MKWDMMQLRRPHTTPRRRLYRKSQRPLVEYLEPRLAPANVDVLTYHYDSLMSGANTQETILTPANVNPTNFGKLFSQPVDGQLYATPLYKSGLTIGGSPHNVAFVFTEHDSVYAFDADSGVQLWQRSFISGGPGGPPPGSGISSVPSADTSSNIFPEYGITGTPVIDPATNTMYLVAQTKEVRSSVAHYVDTLHAIDIRTGSDRATSAAVVIGDSLNDDATHTTALSVPGIGAGSSAQVAAVQAAGSGYAVNDTVVLNGGNPINNQRTVLKVTSVGAGGAITGVTIQTPGTYNSPPTNPVAQLSTSGSGTGATFNLTWVVKFNAWRQLQRPALAMVQGVVYIAFAGYNDQGAYHGWVVGYQASDLTLQGFANLAPNARAAGIWQSGGGLASDGTNLYFATGNTFSGPRPGYSPSDNNFGESVIKLVPGGGTLSVGDWFTPYNWQSLDGADLDLGSGGTMLLPDAVGSSSHPHLMVETGKTGTVYLVDRDNMGHNVPPPGPDTNIVQTFGPLGGPGVWGEPSFFLDQPALHSGLIYYHGSQSDLKALRITNGLITAVASESNQTFGFPGGQPIVSSNGTSNGIVWDLQVDGTSGVTILHAYNALGNPQGVLNELYNSNQTSLRDRAGGPVKFTPATVTNGHVLVGSASSFSVYGLFPSHSAVSAPVTNLAGTGLAGGSQIQLTWNSPSPNDATGIKILRSTNPTSGFTQVAVVGRDLTTFTNTGLAPATQYYYQAVATNQVGDSTPSNTAAVATRLGAPLLAVVNLTHAEIDLSWTQTGNHGYELQRSFNGGAFSTVLSTSDPTVTSYIDTNVATRGTYAYRLTAFNINPTDSAVSNTVSVTNAPIVVDHSTGFATHDDLTGSGNTQFTNGLVRLTTNLNERGSAFTNQRLNIDQFTTSFTFRIHDGSNPPADGFAFVIQNNAPTALGGGGGGLGYSGIGNSVAVKFDMYTQASQHSTTGLFFNGDLNPAQQIDMGDSGIDLRNANVKQVDLTYNGTTLHEVVTDTVTHASFIHDYTVNIASPVGSDSAFVGFTGATGGLNALQDIQTWVFNPGPGLPGAPVSALATVSGANINLSWVSHSVNEDGFKVERSDNSPNNFREIASVTAPRFTDPNLPFGNYYYRVRAFNSQGNSPYSNTANIVVGPISAFADHSGGFASHADLQLNGADVVGSRLRLTDGDGNEARTAWTTTKVGVSNFSTSFILQDQNVQGSADGITFALQNNDPGQVGGAGGCLGYCGIVKSVAIMFDLYSGGSHNSTTNLLMNGNKTGAIDMGPSGIVLGSNHPLRIDLSYDITQLAFSETVTDTVTGAIFSHIYTNVNVPQIVQGSTAYIGFTGGTGGETAIQDIVSWSGRFLDPVQPTSHVSLSAPNATAGTPITVAVTARDAFNNVKTDYRGTVHLTSNDPQATLPADAAFTAGDNGVHTFSGVILRTAGAPTVSAQDTAATYITGSTTIPVVAAAASTFAPAYPVPTTAGVNHLFTITAMDPYGNVAPTYRGTVHLTSSDSQAILSPDDTFTAADQGTHTFAAAFFTAATQTLTARDTQTATIVGTQTLTVVPAAAASLTLSGFPSPVLAGAAGSITVTAVDRFGNTGAVYTGTVHFTSSDPAASLPADYHFIPSDRGTHTFDNVTLGTVGTQSITVTDPVNNFTSTQSNIVVYPARFDVTGFSSPSPAGSASIFTVTVRNADGSVATGYTGTVTFSSSDGQATLPDDYTFQPGDNGRHTFGAVLRTAGAQSITATDTSFSALSGTQSSINITPLTVAGSFVVADFPSPTIAGTPGSFTVTVKDIYGNTATGYTGTVTFSSSDGQVTLPGDYAFQPGDSGTHTFTATLRTAGTQSITVTDTGNGASGTQGGIEVDPGVAVTLAVYGYPSPVTVGSLNLFTVTGVDQFGNFGATYTGRVHFTSTDPAATLPDDYTFQPGEGGTHVFAAAFNTVGTWSLTATDTVDPTITGTQDNIEADAGPSLPARGRGPSAAFLAGPLAPTLPAQPPSIPAATATSPTQVLLLASADADGVYRFAVTAAGNDYRFALRGVRQELSGNMEAMSDALGLALSDWTSVLHGPAVDDLIRARMS
jgi:hypothetical protein